MSLAAVIGITNRELNLRYSYQELISLLAAGRLNKQAERLQNLLSGETDETDAVLCDAPRIAVLFLESCNCERRSR
jgi:hypothetical protein